MGNQLNKACYMGVLAKLFQISLDIICWPSYLVHFFLNHESTKTYLIV